MNLCIKASGLPLGFAPRLHGLFLVGLFPLAAIAITLAGCDSQPASTVTADQQQSPSATVQSATVTTAQTLPPPGAQDELRTLYQTSPGILAEARTQAVFSQFRPLRGAGLTMMGDTLKVTAIDADPQMLLPSFTQGRRFIIEATVTSPAETLMQVFYLRKGQPSYSDGQSQTALLSAGKNVVYFRIDVPDLMDPLRVDIGAAPGDYLIERMTAKVLP